MGKRCLLLRELQPGQGRSFPGAGEHAALEAADSSAMDPDLPHRRRGGPLPRVATLPRSGQRILLERRTRRLIDGVVRGARVIMATMTKPLLGGLRVLVTRPGCHPTDRWGTALTAAGATVVPYPTIEVVPPPSWEPLDHALAQLTGYDWLVFTSASAVRFTFSRLGGARPCPCKPQIAAVGLETARALEHAGTRVDLVPSTQQQEGLVEAFRCLPPGTQVLFPRALDGREVLVDSLRRQGCRVDVVVAYQTIPVKPLPPLPTFDVALFASPSALRALVEQHGTEALVRKTVAVIGPTTAAEATRYGIPVVAASQPNIEALISAIVRERSSPGGF